MTVKINTTNSTLFDAFGRIVLPGSTYDDTGLTPVVPAPEAPKTVKLTELGARGAVAVAPSDTVDLAVKPTKGLYVGVAGDVKVILADGSTAVLKALAAGVIHEMAATRVYATGTTATDILAIY